MRNLLLPLVALAAAAQPRHFPLETAANLKPHNVTVEPVTHQGKPGVRVLISEESRKQIANLPIAQQTRIEQLAVLEGTSFTNGVIEVELAGEPAPGAPAAARGFVGIAFRLQPDMQTYDAFYLRPTNGRADDQIRRNHSAQYISHPAWTFQRFRDEAPEKYESYVDLVPSAWTKIRIEVQGPKARFFVHGQPQPTLIVNDLKTNPDTPGAIALWINPGTLAHFRNLRITRTPNP